MKLRNLHRYVFGIASTGFLGLLTVLTGLLQRHQQLATGAANRAAISPLELIFFGSAFAVVALALLLTAYRMKATDHPRPIVIAGEIVEAEQRPQLTDVHADVHAHKALTQSP